MNQFRYKLTIAYDGTEYCGWQIQPSGVSIQSLIEAALSTILRFPIKVVGSGRTDAGVHAEGQTAHFSFEKSLDLLRLRYSVNALLPSDIQVLEIDCVSLDFHARYGVTSKVYHYYIHLDPVMNPFVRLYRHRPIGSVNLDRVARAAIYFLGTKDFISFANESHRGSASRNSIRTLFRLDLTDQKGGVRLEFEGDGFLYKMVRNITGVLLDVGMGKLEPTDIPAIFAAKDRKLSSAAAPPQGLFLSEVRYTQRTHSSF